MQQQLIDAIPLPVLVVGTADKVLRANSLARSVLPGVEVGRNIALILRAPEFLGSVASVLSGRVGADEARFQLSRDGRQSVWTSTVTAVDGETGREALCVLRDLSEEVLASQMRRDFVANVSHELRTPLTALIGFIETLRGAAKDDPTARDRFLAIMEREAGRMNRLVQDLLHLSRVEAEERVRPREPVDLSAVVRGVVAGLRPMSEGLGSQVVTEGLEGPLTVPGDADQLVQVFTNLVENGLKYGATGQVLRVVATREDTVRGPAVKISVIDRGEGIDAVHIPRLTERFYRVDSHRSREKGGTGLGLAIVKHIVARHRGWLRIESVKSEGSVFSVVLPEG